MAEKVEAYLNNKKNTAKPFEIAEIFQMFEQNYSKKLWNQLANETEKYIYNEKFIAFVNLKEFYDNFIFEFEHRINTLQLIHIILPISKFLFSKNPAEAYEFLEKFKRHTKKNLEADVRLASGLIELHLNHKDENGVCVDIGYIRKLIEETQQKLDLTTGVTSVHSSFYKVSALYLKEIGDHAAYYREALRYLGCENLDNLSTQEKLTQATLLGFAALLGKDIYNFGELLAHPIIKVLQGSPDNWLYDFLLAFNAGDLKTFYAFEKQWSQWPDLLKHRNLIENKIRLLSLMEISLTRSAKERHISFTEIAEQARVELNYVEFLVMKALSKGLVCGSIDQVNQIVTVTWIQPRVLSLEQVSLTADRIDTWRKKVDQMELLVAENAKEIIIKT